MVVAHTSNSDTSRLDLSGICSLEKALAMADISKVLHPVFAHSTSENYMQD